MKKIKSKDMTDPKTRILMDFFESQGAEFVDVTAEVDEQKCCHYPGVGHCWHCKATDNPQIHKLCPDWEPLDDHKTPPTSSGQSQEWEKAQSRPAGLNWWGHQMDAKDKPTQDDDGDWASYAKCSKCGVVENTDESIMICPRAEYIHISVFKQTIQQTEDEWFEKAIELVKAARIEEKKAVVEDFYGFIDQRFKSFKISVALGQALQDFLKEEELK